MHRPSPALVQGLADAVELAAGHFFTCARTASGQVLCWGYDYFGQLGDGRSGARMTSSEPVEVAGLTDAVQLEAGQSHVCARRRGGEVVCWGDNEHGQLGDGSRELRSRPVAVAGVLRTQSRSPSVRPTHVRVAATALCSAGARTTTVRLATARPTTAIVRSRSMA